MRRSFVPTTVFATAAGIAASSAKEGLRRCHSGKTWRGVKLNVVTELGVGGRSGIVYSVAVDSLPADIRARLELEAADAVERSATDTVSVTSEPQRERAKLRRHVVRNAKLNGIAATAKMVWQTPSRPRQYGASTS